MLTWYLYIGTRLSTTAHGYCSEYRTGVFMDRTGTGISPRLSEDLYFLWQLNSFVHLQIKVVSLAQFLRQKKGTRRRGRQKRSSNFRTGTGLLKPSACVSYLYSVLYFIT